MPDELRTYRVAVSPRAAQMLASHAAFLAGVSRAAADRLVKEFNASANSLTQMPNRCPWFVSDYVPGYKYRYLIFEKRYFMIYQVIDDAVYIEYVIDCRQDYDWLIR